MATEQDNVNSGALGTLVAVGTIAMLGISLVVTALVRAELAEEVEKKEVSADRAYRDLLAEQTAKLNAPAAYADRGRGLVSLPIDRAMELTVAALSKDPNSATPPAPIGGSGAGGAGGSSGQAGANSGGGGAGGTSAAPAGEDADPKRKDGDAAKPDEGAKKSGEKAPKNAPGAPGSPAAPSPVLPAPGPGTPSPAPHGQ
jgi:hypothetical protein